LAFGFDDKKPTFEMGFWLANFLRVTLVVMVAFLTKELVRKLVAKAQGFETEYSLWNVSRFGFKPTSVKKPVPVGIIISLIVTIVTMGKLFMVAVGSYDLIINKHSRFGRKTVHINDYDEAKIALVGPLVNIALMIVFQLFNRNGMFDQFVFINGMIALFHMIPVSNLDGAKIFFGSKVLYLFSLAFIVGVVFLINVLSPIITLALAVVFSAIFAGTYYYYRIYK